MTTYATIRATALFKDHSRTADILQPLMEGMSLRFAGTKTTDNNEVFLNVVFSPPGGGAVTGWVIETHCRESEDVRPAVKVDGFIRTCLLTERLFNNLPNVAPWFVAADFVIARALIETGLTNVGGKIKGSDGVGPLQVTSTEWEALLKDGGAFAKDLDPLDRETDRDNPQVQVFGAVFSMHVDAKAISDQKTQAGVGTKDDPFLPSYADLFHAYLTGSTKAAVAIRNAQDKEPDKKVSEVLAGLLTDAQTAVLFEGRDQFKGKIIPDQKVSEFVAVTEPILTDALQKAFDLIKLHCPEELPTTSGSEAPWFDVALEEEKKNIDEHNAAQRDIILGYFNSTDFRPRPTSTATPWCGAFAAHCMHTSDNPVPKGSAAARNWKSWGVGLPLGGTDIPRGAVIVLSPSDGTGSTGHVAFFNQFVDNGKKVELLGGNQSDKLNRTAFLTSKIAAIRWINSAPTTSAAQFGETASATKISKKAFDMIVGFEVSSEAVYEKKYRGPIWPGFKSGVTIGIGYDIGQTGAAVVQADWSGVISDAMLAALKTAVGVTGPAAQQRAAQLKGQVDVPFSAAIKVHSDRVIPRWVAVVEKALGPNTSSLSPDCLGALVSLTYNRGPSFSKAGPRYEEMRAIKDCVANRRFADIPAQFRKMKRLWPSTSGLPGRRDKEADLFQKGLP